MTDGDIQPKGETLTNRILYLLGSAPGEPYNPYTIARILNAKRTSITSILSRLRRAGKVQSYRRGKSKPIPGFYCISEDLEDREILERIRDPPALHNIKIYLPEVLVTVGEEKYRKRREDLIREISRRIPDAEQKGSFFYLEISPRRKLTIGIHNNGSLEAWLKCGENPLPIPDYPQYIRFLEMLIGPEIWRSSDPVVQQMEFNQDARGVQISGLSSISVERSIKETVQIYNKHLDGDLLRAEKRYFLELSPDAIAREISRIDKQGDNLVLGSRIQEIQNNIRSQENQIRGIHQEIRALTSLLALSLKSRSIIPGDPGPIDPSVPDPGPIETSVRDLPGYG